MQGLSTLLLIIFVIDVILLIPVILMQSGSGAEAGLFGSDLTMGAFGAKSSEVLVNLTKWLIAIFMLSAFLWGYIQVKETKKYQVDQTNISEDSDVDMTEEVPVETETSDTEAMLEETAETPSDTPATLFDMTEEETTPELPLLNM